MIPARLACVRHAASVRPEPGSNSYVQSLISSWCSGLHRLTQDSKLFSESTVFSLRLRFFSLFCIVFKDRSRRFERTKRALSRRRGLVYHAESILSTQFLNFFVLVFNLMNTPNDSNSMDLSIRN